MFGGSDFLSKAYQEYVKRLFEKFGHSGGEKYIRRLTHPASIFCTALEIRTQRLGKKKLWINLNAL